MTSLTIRAGLISLCLLTSTIVSVAQIVSQSLPDQPAEISRQPAVKIVYTGRLLGYFRSPSKQSGAVIERCTQSMQPDSQAAIDFLRNGKNYADAILVGTGDNFAPRLEARDFDPEPLNPKPGRYRPRNKEPYTWDQKNNTWVLLDEVKDAQARQEMEAQVHAGEATIPTDNVACFLAKAGFRAIVPGKHDFYFAPERVRQLARLMAGSDPAVQMLGANLVIKTTRLADAPPPPDKEKWIWPTNFPVKNLKEGKSVYPWFSSVQVQMKEFEPDSKVLNELKKLLASKKRLQTEQDFLDLLETVPTDQEKSELREQIKKFKAHSIYVCRAEDRTKKITSDDGCVKEEARRIYLSGDTVIDEVALVPEESGRFSTLRAGESYQLILKQPKDSQTADFFNLRFSVYRPFFYFPHPLPAKGLDPDPYVFLKEKNVAIFGVVDPNIGEQIGVLNFSWLNVDDKLKVDRKLKTVVSAEDPVESLRQQLRQFELKYHQDDAEKPALKILLAQMNPQRARALAAHFPELQIVVTEADDLQGTSEVEQSTVWSPESTKSGTFLAVPSPYYYPGSGKDIEGKVHFGTILAAHEGSQKWKLSAKAVSEVQVPASGHDPTNPSEIFNSLINGSLKKCLSTYAGQKPDDLARKPKERIRGLTLCAMREQAGADVALIQQRDLFDEFTVDEFNTGGKDERELVQLILDRIIWKGDLLTLLYVQGSALRKALEQSQKYEKDDSNFLSLSDEKWRGLYYLGIDKSENEYLVNEVPLDDKKIYAVATSDYIGAGDTGYPDLAAMALNPKSRPTQFPEKMESISSIVCRGLFSEADATRYCRGPSDSHDRSTFKAPPPHQRPSLAKGLLKLFPFSWPAETPKATKTAEALEQRAQWHPTWILSLKNFSFGFNSLSNNLADAQLSQKFAGVPTSGVTARKTHSVTVGLDTRLSRSSHANEFFIATGIDFREQSTGDVAPSIVQISNRLTGDAGFIRNLRGGRSPSHVGLVFTLHAETPLQRPFTTFTLGTQDRLKIIQGRGILLLPRIGLRWQNRANFFEVGAQMGKEINALSGYRFVTSGVTVECLPQPAETFAACISKLSKPPVTSITKDSAATAILQTRPRSGFYWKFGLSIPLGEKVKYELSQEADFFFEARNDNATDTRYRDLSKHSLKFSIWPSFSIGPTLQLLFYQNKLNRDFLFQKQLGLQANVSFDLFNRREKVVQLKHKP